MILPLLSQSFPLSSTLLAATAGPGLAITSGRLGAMVAALLGLIGIAVGSAALRRAFRAQPDLARRLALGAITSGILGLVFGGLVALMAPAGVGTGHGFGGAIVALVIGLIALGVGGLAFARSRPPR